jgi:hypothetical protein
MAKATKTIVENEKTYSLHKVSVDNGKKLIGWVPVWNPQSEDEVNQFIKTHGLEQTVDWLRQGAAVSLQSQARSLYKSDGHRELSLEDAMRIVSNNPKRVEELTNDGKNMLEAAKIIAEEQQESDDYGEEYIFRCFM